MRYRLFVFAGMMVLCLQCGPKNEVATESADQSSPTFNQQDTPESAPKAAPIRVLVLADGFIPTDGEWFRDDKLPQIRAAFDLLPGAKEGGVQIELTYLGSASPTESKSVLGLEYRENEPENCYFINRKEKLAEIYKYHDSVQGFSPNRYLVMLANDGNGACALNDVMFVRQNIGPNIIAHEMGHSIAGLFDEYVGKAKPNSCVSGRNCSKVKKDDTWIKGCNHSDDFYRSSYSCRMDKTSLAFCALCSNLIREALDNPVEYKKETADGSCSIAGTASPWLLASTAKRGVDVLAVIGEDKSIKVVDVVASDPATLRPEVITGEYFLTAFLGTKVVGAASIASEGEGFNSRSYDSDGRDTPVKDDRSSVRLTLYGLTMEQALSQDLKFGLRRVTNATMTLRMHDTMIENLRDTFGSKKISLTDQIQSVLQAH